jgi:hypothetical protein
MRITPPLAAAVAVLIAAVPDCARAATLDVPVTPLVIRLYDAAPDESAGHEGAIAEASAILTEAGLASEWVACAPVAPPAARRCARPLAGVELSVRFVRSRVTNRAPELPGPRLMSPFRQPLGYSLVDEQTKSGSLATIYLDRVAWLAAEARARLAPLLGRAIAHEIGHLLLGTGEHAPTGIMRATWSREVVRDGGPADWRFLAAEAKRMQRAAAAREAAHREAANIVWGD